MKHDARTEEETSRLLERPWRQGRRVLRNVYAQLPSDAVPSDDDVYIGNFDSAALAEDAVYWHNASLGKNERIYHANERADYEVGKGSA